MSFAICCLLAGLGILLVLLFKLLKSYPLAFFGVAAVVAAGIIAIVKEEMIILGVFWIAFSVICALTAALHLYKNIRGAFWWWLGSVGALIATAITQPDKTLSSEDLGEFLVPIAIPLGIFLVVGLLGSLIMPRVMYRDKNERKHLTNTDPLIGVRVEITKDKEDGRPQRGYIGDVDWAIEPLFPYESFKVGDIVKVNKIKGVTLLCTRDGKDLREEMKEQRKADLEKARAEAEVKRAERLAKKEAKKAEKEAKKKAKEEAKKNKPKKEKVKKEKKAPKKEEPKVEEPKVEEPKAEEPKVEEAAKEEPKVEEKVEEVKPEEPKEEPKAEEPKPEEPKVEQPKKEKAEFVPFAVRLQAADPFVREAYNELKSEVLSYGIKSRVSSTGDTFRLHTKAYVKMVIAGKYLKLYFALDPKDYENTTYPFEDASRMELHKDTPFVFKIKSGLSIRRAKVLIADAAKKDELVQGEVVKHDHAADVKVED